MLLQFAIIFLFLTLGELVIYLTGIPIPASIIGMILLTIALKVGIIKESWVATLADFFVKNLGFFFIPAGVGVMACFGLIKEQIVPIAVSTIVSTFLIIAFTGWGHQLTRRLLKISKSRHTTCK